MDSRRIALAAAGATLALALAACGSSDVTDDTEFEGESERDALAAAVEDGRVLTVFEKTRIPDDTGCVVDAIEDGGLTDEQKRVILIGGDPDPVDDENWDAMTDAVSDCDD